MAAIMAGAAYRSGSLDLTSTGATRVATPLVGASSRIFFAAFALILALMFVINGAAGARRLWRDWNRRV